MSSGAANQPALPASAPVPLSGPAGHVQTPQIAQPQSGERFIINCAVLSLSVAGNFAGLGIGFAGEPEYGMATVGASTGLLLVKECIDPSPTTLKFARRAKGSLSTMRKRIGTAPDLDRSIPLSAGVTAVTA